MIHCQHVVQSKFSMLYYYRASEKCPMKNLIICAAKIEALTENFEAVKLIVGGYTSYPIHPPESIPEKCDRKHFNKLMILIVEYLVFNF